MTDVKPFTRDEPEAARDRSVAVVLVCPGVAGAGEVPAPLDPFGGSNLFDIALRCLDRVEEASERAVWADDAALLEYFEQQGLDGIQLLAAPPDRALQRGAPDALRSSYVALLDGRYPFLRPNTIDEAIRLLRVRPDIETIISCVRTSGVIYDLSKRQAFTGPSHESAMLVSCRAFWLVPAESLSFGRPPERAPYAFEVGQSEGFRVDSPFTRDLAGPYLASR